MSLPLNQCLADWVDGDVAMREIGRCLMGSQAPEERWIFESANSLGSRLTEILDHLVQEGILEENPTRDQFRWNTSYSYKNSKPGQTTPLQPVCENGKCFQKDYRMLPGSDYLWICRCGLKYRFDGPKWLKVGPDGTLIPYMVRIEFKGWFPDSTPDGQPNTSANGRLGGGRG